MLPGAKLGATLLPRARDQLPSLLGLGAPDHLLPAGRSRVSAGQRLRVPATNGSATNGSATNDPATLQPAAGSDRATAGAATRRSRIPERQPEQRHGKPALRPILSSQYGDLAAARPPSSSHGPAGAPAGEFAAQGQAAKHRRHPESAGHRPDCPQ